METFNEKIKRIRKSKGLNQTDVCLKIGITQPSFASIEAGRTKSISIDLGKKIAGALEIPFNELFDIEVAESKVKEVELKAEIDRLNDIIKGQVKFITLLEKQNEFLEPFRPAFIQERTISELMVYATIEKMKELYKKGEKFETTSFDVRQDAIAVYKKEYPDIELNPYLFISPGEMKKQP